MNFSGYEFFDHHTHLLDPKQTVISKRDFVFRFLHGYMDMDPLDQKGLDSAYSWGHASEKQVNNMANLGVAKVITNFMAGYFGCEADIDAVLEARNSFIGGSEEKLKAHTKALYNDQKIIGTVLDSNDPWGNTKHEVFPCPVYRLYNFEDDYFELLPKSTSFDDLMDELLKRARKAIKDGFTAFKGHLAENYTMACQLVTDEQANREFVAAQQGVKGAVENVFFAMMKHMMYLAQELDVVIHIHSGTTGFNRPSACFAPSLDPFLFVPFMMSDRNFIKTKIAFLHQGFPYTRHAGMIAYSYPNVYVDTSWVLPWNALAFRTNLEDVLGVCPHNKILFGTGQHGFPEIAWTAAKVAKATLGDVLEDQVRLGLLSVGQAETTARQLLSENAKALYGI